MTTSIGSSRGAMLYLVIYDISNDKVRKKTADRLLDIGLIRAQFSVFIGTVNANRIDEIALFATDNLQPTDRLYIIPLSRDQLTQSRMIGQAIDQALATDEVITKVI